MKQLAITSGKGGVGKTSLAANISIALAQLGHRVVLFDADLQLANVDVVLGIQPEFNLQHVVAEERTLEEILAPGPGGIRVATGASAVPALMSAGSKRMGAFMSQLESLEASTDYLIFDTAAGLDNRVITFLKLAHEVILITTPEPTSITDAYATMKVAFRREPEAKVHVVVNQCSAAYEGKTVFLTLQSAVEGFLDQSIDLLGIVHHDDVVNLAIRRRKPFLLAAKDSRASKDVMALARTIVRWDAAKDADLEEPMKVAA